MTHLRRRIQEDLRLRNFSERTIRHYTHTIAKFAKYFHKSPDQLGPEHVRTYLLFLLNERKLAWGTIQGTRSALKFLYTRTLKQTWFDQEVIKPKIRHKLPTVWSRDEVRALLDAETNTKHRALLALYYSAGLRCQEALDLKVTDANRRINTAPPQLPGRQTVLRAERCRYGTEIWRKTRTLPAPCPFSGNAVYRAGLGDPANQISRSLGGRES